MQKDGGHQAPVLAGLDERTVLGAQQEQRAGVRLPEQVQPGTGSDGGRNQPQPYVHSDERVGDHRSAVDRHHL